MGFIVSVSDPEGRHILCQGRKAPAEETQSQEGPEGLPVSTVIDVGDDCNSQRIQHLRRCGFGPWLAALSTLCNVLLRFTTNCVPDSVPSIELERLKMLGENCSILRVLTVR